MKRKRSSMIDIVFTLALFVVFAASALAVTLIGASVYKRTTADMKVNFDDRTAVSYLVQKVRQHDTDKGISLGEFKGTQALVLTKTYGELETTTYIYYYDGYIRELSLMNDIQVSLADGQGIVEAKGFQIEQVTLGLYRVKFTNMNDQVEEVFLESFANGGNDET